LAHRTANPNSNFTGDLKQQRRSPICDLDRHQRAPRFHHAALQFQHALRRQHRPAGRSAGSRGYYLPTDKVDEPRGTAEDDNRSPASLVANGRGNRPGEVIAEIANDRHCKNPGRHPARVAGPDSQIECYGTYTSTDKLCVISLSVSQLTPFATKAYRLANWLHCGYLAIVFHIQIKCLTKLPGIVGGQLANELYGSCVKHRKSPELTWQSGSAVHPAFIFLKLDSIGGAALDAR